MTLEALGASKQQQIVQQPWAKVAESKSSARHLALELTNVTMGGTMAFLLHIFRKLSARTRVNALRSQPGRHTFFEEDKNIVAITSNNKINISIANDDNKQATTDYAKQ